MALDYKIYLLSHSAKDFLTRINYQISSVLTINRSVITYRLILELFHTMTRFDCWLPALLYPRVMWCCCDLSCRLINIGLVDLPLQAGQPCPKLSNSLCITASLWDRGPCMLSDTKDAALHKLTDNTGHGRDSLEKGCRKSAVETRQGMKKLKY